MLELNKQAGCVSSLTKPTRMRLALSVISRQEYTT